jgi:hypothetical protein
MAPLNNDSPSVQTSSSFEIERKEEHVVSNFIEMNTIAKLRSELGHILVRYEELEQDRNYNAMKANELQNVLNAFKMGEIHEVLLTKSLQLAQVLTEVDCLCVQLKKIQKERDEGKSKQLALSVVVRSLQSVTTSDSEDDEDEDGDQVILTAEKALDMTLKNMKLQVEYHEDENQKLAQRCKLHERTIESLTKENDLNAVKVEMLEEILRALNEEHHSKPASETASPAIPKETVKVLLEKTPSNWSVPALKFTTKMNTLNDDPSVNGRLEEASYTGPISDGIPNGTGIVRFKNGDTYLGEIVNGEMHGKGTLYYHQSRELGMQRGQFEHNVFMSQKV